MLPAFLHLDEALADQPALIDAGLAAGGRAIDGRLLGPQLRLWSRPPALDALTSLLATTLPAADGPTLIFAGSGDFHHISALLIARAAEASGRPFTVIHVDNHPDWVKFGAGMHCGSWVGRAARHPAVARFVTLGVCSSDIRQPWRKSADLALLREERLDLFAYRSSREDGFQKLGGRLFPTIDQLGEVAFLDMLMARISTRDVYVTIDKDALRADDAVTNWDQGALSLDFLIALIDRLRTDFALIGADVVGDHSTPVYGGPLMSRLRKRGESLIDQPRRPIDRAYAARVNARANHAIAAAFGAFG